MVVLLFTEIHEVSRNEQSCLILHFLAHSLFSLGGCVFYPFYHCPEVRIICLLINNVHGGSSQIL